MVTKRIEMMPQTPDMVRPVPGVIPSSSHFAAHNAPPPPATHASHSHVPNTALTVEQWQDIEKLYRTTTAPMSEIASSFGISTAILASYAKRAGWARDLGAQVREGLRTRSLEYDAAIAGTIPSSSDEEIVDGAVRTQHAILVAHRHDIARLRHTTQRISSRITGVLDAMDGIDRLVRVRVGLAPDDPRREDLEEALTIAKEQLAESRRILGERETIGDLLEKVSRSTERTINMERQAYGLDVADPDAPARVYSHQALVQALTPDARAKLRAVAAALVDAGGPQRPAAGDQPPGLPGQPG